MADESRLPRSRCAVLAILGILACLVQPATPYLVAGSALAGARFAPRNPPRFSVQLLARDARRPCAALSLRCFYADACGRLLIARSSAARVLGDEFRQGIALLVVETSSVGETTALVVNRPTPLLLGHLDLPRFHAFKDCRLFHGGALESQSELGADRSRERPPHPLRRRNVTGGSNLLSNVADTGSSEPHCLSPHHWIHKAEGIKGSTALTSGIYYGMLPHNSEEMGVSVLGDGLD
jgi:hypothetical protein